MGRVYSGKCLEINNLEAENELLVGKCYDWLDRFRAAEEKISTLRNRDKEQQIEIVASVKQLLDDGEDRLTKDKTEEYMDNCNKTENLKKRSEMQAESTGAETVDCEATFQDMRYQLSKVSHEAIRECITSVEDIEEREALKKIFATLFGGDLEQLLMEESDEECNAADGDQDMDHDAETC